MYEHHFQCPYCWETISMFLESLAEEQFYIEDCEVCCRPIQLRYLYDRELIHFSVSNLEE